MGFGTGIANWLVTVNLYIGALMSLSMVRHFGAEEGSGGDDLTARLNLLLSYGGWDAQNWAEQLPQLLRPMGISSIRVNSGQEAARIISERPIHIAVVDLRLPLDDEIEGEESSEGGLRILKILRRLEAPPPTVVVRHPSDRDRAREHQRSLHQALRDGAFAVFDVPVPMEQLLETMRRILKRYYRGAWPGLN